MTTIRPTVATPIRRPVVAPAAARAAKPAAAPKPVAAAAAREPGGQSGIQGHAKALAKDGLWLAGVLFRNCWSSFSGIMSIFPDLAEFRDDPKHKVAHAIEIAGDIINLATWPVVALIAPEIALRMWGAGFVIKSVGEVMAGRDGMIDPMWGSK